MHFTLNVNLNIQLSYPQAFETCKQCLVFICHNPEVCRVIPPYLCAWFYCVHPLLGQGGIITGNLGSRVT